MAKTSSAPLWTHGAPALVAFGAVEAGPAAWAWVYGGAALLVAIGALGCALLIWRRLCRIAIEVGVSYRANPDQVLAVLRRVAGQCPLVRREPAPLATLEDFGPSALVFALRAAAPAPGKRLAAATDLRLRILKAFREQGIEIAFPQHDVHLRDLDMVRHVVARFAEERAQKAASERPPGPQGAKGSRSQ